MRPILGGETSNKSMVILSDVSLNSALLIHDHMKVR